MKREKKEQIVKDVAEKLQKAQGIYLTEFQGLDVEKMAELRNEFRKAGVEYQVAKNTLIKKALENVNGGDRLADGLVNTTGMAIGYDDPIAPAKIIEKFGKKNEMLKFKMATIDGSVFEADKLQVLSKMLSKTENIGRFAGMLNNVISSVPMVINAVMSDLVSVIDQVAKQKQD
ncbi:MAG: 50S ribosomal protein L10 [Chlorobium phaeobacteroides]|uniref:Large ribosomal subunit protein uL10 n=1 Tax=Chlorobium phaeobacteroides (strain BS1) TaxID=331678 RepID=RL10_CHLPB|nr:RecName: Full=Large ribosomal subunit protein uL10; AltName: Full=50S ribosomal protein L10 [Chlorobium phaeobacteroides BS1]MBC8524956.1 50S ribosomal protein L10 [Chlorobium phaeobacteroides]MBL6955255.1 50S ribosomal protein L10 [Chlorobium phaeobacteroides]NEX13384.1 50S ribosomal protein L10 [Prosthecochloris sp.]